MHETSFICSTNMGGPKSVSDMSSSIGKHFDASKLCMLSKAEGFCVEEDNQCCSRKHIIKQTNTQTILKIKILRTQNVDHSFKCDFQRKEMSWYNSSFLRFVFEF